MKRRTFLGLSASVLCGPTLSCLGETEAKPGKETERVESHRADRCVEGVAIDELRPLANRGPARAESDPGLVGEVDCAEKGLVIVAGPPLGEVIYHNLQGCFGYSRCKPPELLNVL